MVAIMKSNTAVIFAALGSVLCLTCAPAARAIDPGFYVGAYYGSLSREASKAEDAAVLGSISDGAYRFFDFEPVATEFSLDVDDTSWGFFGGYRWTPNLALEIGYLQLGEVKYGSNDQILDVRESPPVPYQASTRTTAKLSALTLSALGVWPLTYEWEIFGRAGISFTETKWRTRLNVEGLGSDRFGDSKSNASLLAGVGMSYTFLDVYTVRGEYQRVFDAGNDDFVRESDIDLVSIGIAVSF
jgi:OOP family OmpA-OmpF porin